MSGQLQKQEHPGKPICIQLLLPSDALIYCRNTNRDPAGTEKSGTENSPRYFIITYSSYVPGAAGQFQNSHTLSIHTIHQ